MELVVVGAGAAGLACACAASEAGWSVTVLEQSDCEVGGRVRSRSTPQGENIELGAQFLHGAAPGNAAYDIAEAEGLLEVPRVHYAGSAWLLPDGSRAPRSTGAAVKLRAELVDASEEQGDADEADSVLDFLQREWPARAAEEGLDPEDEVTTAAVLWRDLLQRNIDGCHSLADESLRHMGVYEELPGPDRMMGAPYARVVQALAARAERSRVQLGAEAVLVRLEEGVAVECADGRVFSGAAVVVTCSLGVLKAGSLGFAPPLPAAKSEAIARMGFGCVDKLFVTTAPGFWRPNEGGFNFLWTQRALQELLEQRAESPEDAWHAEVFRVDRVGEHTLCYWVNGESTFAMEALSPLEAGRSAVRLLHRFSPRPEGASLEPVDVQRSMWASDRHFRGSYSYIRVGSGPEDLAALAAPVDGRLFFAGEATHPTHFSTVHGAIESGRRAFAEVQAATAAAAAAER